MTGTFLVFDGNNVLMRAVHAVHYSRRSTVSTGPDEASQIAAGALDLFIGMVSRRIREERPERVVMAWDSSPSWREQLCSTYKANRNKPSDRDAEHSAFALAKEFSYLAGLTPVACPGMEADDLIAAYWRGATSALVKRLVIVSSDGDFAQLLGPTAGGSYCEQVKPFTDAHDRLTRHDAEEKWGCHPDQIPLVKAMAGDQSDNVIGLNKIGPKRAVARLSGANWVLADAVADLPVTERERVALNLRLVDLREGGLSLPPPPTFLPHPPESREGRRVIELMRELGLTRVVAKLQSEELWQHRQDISEDEVVTPS